MEAMHSSLSEAVEETIADINTDTHDTKFIPLDGTSLLILCLCLSICFILTYFINMSKISHLPSSAAVMLVGFISGLIPILLKFMGAERYYESVRFDPQLLYLVLLPPIIFEAGFSLNKENFISNVGTILLFAVIGTFIATVVFAGGILLTGRFVGFKGSNFTLQAFAWIYAALISNIDPVATISILKSNRFESVGDFYIIIFGESVLNDSVGIILARAIESIFMLPSNTSEMEDATLFSVLGNFLFVSVGSCIAGVITGGACSLIFRFSSIHMLPHLELAVITLCIYLSFVIAEIFTFSGTVSLFFCGIMLGHYNMYNLSPESKESAELIFKTVSFLCEQFLYLYLGFVACTSIISSAWSFNLIWISFVLCFLSRVANVLPLSFLANRWRHKDRQISFQQQLVMILSGLRGAVAFTLALSIPCTSRIPREDCTHNHDLVITTTITVIGVTTVLVGSTLEFTSLKLGVVKKREHSGSYRVSNVDGQSTYTDVALAPIEETYQYHSAPLIQRGETFASETSEQSSGGESDESREVAAFNEEIEVEEGANNDWRIRWRSLVRNMSNGVSTAFSVLENEILQPLLGGPNHPRFTGHYS